MTSSAALLPACLALLPVAMSLFYPMCRRSGNRWQIITANASLLSLFSRIPAHTVFGPESCCSHHLTVCLCISLCLSVLFKSILILIFFLIFVTVISTFWLGLSHPSHYYSSVEWSVWPNRDLITWYIMGSYPPRESEGYHILLAPHPQMAVASLRNKLPISQR